MPADPTVTRILQTAYESITAASLPAELHATALEKAIDLLAAKEGIQAPSMVAVEVPRVENDPAKAQQNPSDTAHSRLQQIADKLNVSVHAVKEVFHVDGDELALSLGSSALAAAKTNGTKEIALLVAGGRQAGGWDVEWTPTSKIREVCETFGRLDEANFARTIALMTDQFSFGGTGRSRRVKLKRKGTEDTAALVKRLSGEG